MADGASPNMQRVATALIKSGFDYRDEFEFGLDLILDAHRAPTGRPADERRGRRAARGAEANLDDIVAIRRRSTADRRSGWTCPRRSRSSSRSWSGWASLRGSVAG